MTDRPVVGPSRPPYFFLGYAHTPEHPWVGRFYRDLCAEITERTEWPTHLSPGFIDASGIHVGEDWRLFGPGTDPPETQPPPTGGPDGD